MKIIREIKKFSQTVKQFTARQVLSLRYSGKKYSCIVCGAELVCFLRLPDYYFEELNKNQFIHSIFAAETLNILHYSCPVCRATDRDRLCALYLKKIFETIDPSKKYRFIDFAPSASLAKFIKRYTFLEYRTADLSMEGVDDQVNVMSMDKYPDASVDMFLCSHVLEHVEDDRKAMSELHRILKPTGFGIVLAPIFLTLKQVYENPAITAEADRWKHFGQHDHVRLYSKEGFIARLEETGFIVNQLGVEHFGQKVFEKNGIYPRSVLYVVKKK